LRNFLGFAAFLFTAAITSTIEARTLRWVRAGDAVTLDPHAVDDPLTRGLNRQIYETLLTRNPKGELVGELAASWRTTPFDASTWEFKLRPGVKFHNGAALTADDVVFSLQRAMAPPSELRTLLSSVERVAKVDELTVRVKTRGQNPTVLNHLAQIFILNRAWAEANGAGQPPDVRGGPEGFAARNANGTGPFVLASREPGLKTVLRRNEQYWDKGFAPLEAEEVVFTPIRSGAARIAGLISGEIDVVQDVPVEDVDRLKSARNVMVVTAPQNATVFLGFDVGQDPSGPRNPFADKRVRQAVNFAVDRTLLQQIMRGQAMPAGLLVPSTANGWRPDLDRPPAPDPARAKALLAEAGYPEGFSTALHCRGDSVIGAETVCAETAGRLARIGIVATLVTQPSASLSALLAKTPPEPKFYLAAWTAATLDSEAAFATLYHTKDARYGGANASRFSNPELDRKIESLPAVNDPAKRAAAVAEIWAAAQDEALYIPLYHPTLAYATRSGVEIPADPENQLRLKLVTFKGP
jgi:peptide/nickel transport system substrate-binding protein